MTLLFELDLDQNVAVEQIEYTQKFHLLSEVNCIYLSINCITVFQNPAIQSSSFDFVILGENHVYLTEAIVI